MRPPFLPKDHDYSGLFSFFAFLAAVAIGLLFLAHAAFAQEPNSSTKQDRCDTIENVITNLEQLPAEIRNTLHIRVLTANETARWGAAFNAIPPKSSMRFDKVAFIRRDGNTHVVLLSEVGGCITGAVRIQMAVHQRLLRDSGLTLGKVL